MLAVATAVVDRLPQARASREPVIPAVTDGDRHAEEDFGRSHVREQRTRRF
ncbi:hypothetical protein [Nocardia sp. NPDC049149]|uniref:hypothetical protein n=1 Tax=Nocardia sp. NPDC049149 TaxID=3364315 RepID=UPI00371B655A